MLVLLMLLHVAHPALVGTVKASFEVVMGCYIGRQTVHIKFSIDLCVGRRNSMLFVETSAKTAACVSTIFEIIAEKFDAGANGEAAPAPGPPA